MRIETNMIWIVAVCSLLVEAGCETRIDPRYAITGVIDRNSEAESQRQWDRLNASSGPFQIQCLSVPRPTGKKWNLASFTLPSSNSISFTKLFEGPEHNAHASVHIGSLGHTFSTIKEYRGWRSDHGPKGNERNIVLNYTIQPDTKYGPLCLRCYEEIETHRITASSHTILRHKTWAYFFLLPNLPSMEVRVSYTEWGLPDDMPTDLPKDGEEFIQGIGIRENSQGVP